MTTLREFVNRVRVSRITFLLSLSSQIVFAGTTGKIAGRVTDKSSNDPLPSVNVVIVGTSLGTATDLEGYYNIINIPPGRYDIEFRLIGYRTYTIKEVLVVVDRTTKLDASLEEAAVTAEEVVVTAERPIVELNLTSTVATLTDREIQALPVQGLKDIVNLQAGVVSDDQGGLHFRGGRVGEVQFQVNGVSVNNPFNNESSVSIDRSLIQEVQVISGTFDAEYGQAMSAVVNTVLKTGGELFRWSAEAYAGDFIFSGGPRSISYKSHLASSQNYQLSVSGPTGLPNTFFIFSGRRFVFDDFLYGERRFLPTDKSDFAQRIYRPGGDGKEVSMGYTREWSGLARITNRSLGTAEIGYQAIFNLTEGRRTDNKAFDYRFNPDGLAKQRTFSIVHGIDWTHTLSASTFYNLNARQNHVDYKDLLYDDLYDPLYDSAGSAQGDFNYELGAIIQGADFTRFVQKTNGLVLQGALTSQVTRDNLVKAGAEVQVLNVQFGTDGFLGYTIVGGQQALVRFKDRPPGLTGYQPVQTYKPVSLAGYAQDQIEWDDLTVRAGLRMEYFNARAVLPSDLANPANAIQGAPLSMPRRASKKITVAPRLGISFPISTNASVFFSYGHFYQYPGLGTTFSNADYSILEGLQAGDPYRFGVFGNPDIKPERTVHYEFGYKHAITDFLGLNLNMFYKDIRDLLGVEFLETYTGAEYVRFTNVDFGNVFGFAVSLDQRRIGILSSTIDYTLSIAQGNSSDPRETATRSAAGEDPRPRQVPLNWDQRHTLNLTMQLSEPENYSVTTIVKYASGQPYTPALTAGFGGSIEPNAGRKPNGLVIDIRAEKYFRLAGVNISVFGRVLNVLDTRFFNGFVFNDTGSPDYSLTPAATSAQLANPTRFHQPRRIEIGLSMSSSL